MSAILNTATRNPVGFATEIGYMFGAMLATNICLEYVDEGIIQNYLPGNLQHHAHVVATSLKDALQFKIAQFY